jgi:hypothetical protein
MYKTGIIKEIWLTPVRKQYEYSKYRIPKAETIVVRVREATGKKSVCDGVQALHQRVNRPT